MKDENKNQKPVFLFNGDKKGIAEENLNAARMALRAVGLSLRLASEGKSITSNATRSVLGMSDGLLSEGSCFPVSEDGFCEGHALGKVAAELEYAYDKWFKRGSKKTKRHILDAMKHLLRFAELAGVDFFNLEAVENIYKRREKEFEAKAVM